MKITQCFSKFLKDNAYIGGENRVIKRFKILKVNSKQITKFRNIYS